MAARVTAADFAAEVLQSELPVLVDFYSDSCVPCKRMSPLLSRIAYMRDIVSICQEAGIPWCVWNYLSTPNDGNRFSLVDDDTRRILSPELLKACLGENYN